MYIHTYIHAYIHILDTYARMHAFIHFDMNSHPVHSHMYMCVYIYAFFMHFDMNSHSVQTLSHAYISANLWYTQTQTVFKQDSINVEMYLSKMW